MLQSCNSILTTSYTCKGHLTVVQLQQRFLYQRSSHETALDTIYAILLAAHFHGDYVDYIVLKWLRKHLKWLFDTFSLMSICRLRVIIIVIIRVTRWATNTLGPVFSDTEQQCLRNGHSVVNNPMKLLQVWGRKPGLLIVIYYQYPKCPEKYLITIPSGY